jgi:lysophospholipase L1-like esterase
VSAFNGLNTVLLCGDSLTAGTIGIGYKRFIPMNTSVQGLNGATCTAVFSLAKKFLHAHGTTGIGSIVIQAGANDLLIPHMKRNNEAWAEMARELSNTINPPLEDDEQYIQTLEQRLNELPRIANGVPIIFCGIPLLGETTESELNQRRKSRDALAKMVVDSLGIHWCALSQPMEDTMVDLIVGQNLPPSSSYLLDSVVNMENDRKRIRGDLQTAWETSRKRQLLVTIDGVHPNGHGAKAIAEAISLFLPL